MAWGPVRIVCEKGHMGSKHKDPEDALGYLMGKKKCSTCGSTELTYQFI